MQSGYPKGFVWMFDALSDSAHMVIESVGRNAAGDFVLYREQDYVRGASLDTMRFHAVLSRRQYLRYLKAALRNGLVSAENYEHLKTGGPVPGDSGIPPLQRYFR